MPDLVEKQIRDVLVTKLKGLATTGQNVFSYRFYAVPNNKLPALLIYTNEEDIEHVTMGLGSRRKAHQLEVRIEVVAKQANDVEDKIATIYKEVITVLEADPTLNDLLTAGASIKDLVNTGNTKETEEDAEQPAITGIMTWRADYHTQEGAPDVSIP